MKKIFVLILLTLSLFAEKIIIQLDVNVNECGDAKITWTQKATAFQWKMLVQKYGNNPALLKREIIASLPGYELTNFSFKRNDIERTMIFSFDAKGVVKYKGNGIWHFKYEKKFTPRKISPTEWFFTDTENEGNILAEYDISLKLPQRAKKAHLTTNEFDEKVLEYFLKPTIFQRISIVTYIGIGLIFIALVLALIALFYKEKPQKIENQK
ncbi:hypothetical protein [Nitratiruptor tergarcus]|uniref:Uncharacterized protein n=1 Tax=Nitratiruptor tergarcus DSM 16512 TaxID=1069081 RepID=A0A1W1WRA1_9BACT|nr:hypothetical protein [Nitratiruptor tergarcus]SMC08817.1 hypothetical protein SAMN05660197_0591 [Nitratiruptor tergarcus DSM 16512]